MGAWNVRTLLDRTDANRPERRTALVGREIARYKLDIVALSETRLADEGQLMESGAEYTFFWRGRTQAERREAGVGFAIRNHLVKDLESLPQGVNDRIMTLRIPITRNAHATIISAYAPTLTNPEETKEKFYEDLHATLRSVPKTDKLIVMGDFNARVGGDTEIWGPVIGKHGVGKCNSNGELLLQFCTEHNLLITNTVFRLPTRNKTTWMHPRSRHWHLIDYIIVRQKDRQDVRITKSMCGAECWTDHRLIVSKLKIHVAPKRRPQGQKVLKRLNVARLKDPHIHEELQKKLEDHARDIQIMADDVESSWASFKSKVYDVAYHTLGCKKRLHQDWFDENDSQISELLRQKHKLHKDYLDKPCSSTKTAYDNIRHTLQQKLRQMQDQWLLQKANEIQQYADTHDMKRFYDAVKEVYGPRSSGSSPLLSADGTTLLTDKKDILKRWAEHFEAVLNRPSQINDAAINRLPQVEINHQLDMSPTYDELEKAISQLSSGKAPGCDAIPAEVFKVAGQGLRESLLKLFEIIWEVKTLPQDFKDASIIHLYKRKGNRQACDNHRGISLLCIAGKLLARILLNRLITHLESGHLPESQCGFRSARGTADMVFAARQLQEKCQEQNVQLYTTFVDLTKAFDTVSREGLWKIMKKFGCPDTFTEITRQFHDGMEAHVVDDGESSAPFKVTNGVKQGCVLAPTLFSIMFTAMLNDAFRDERPGLDIRYRMDGGVFNLRRLQAKTKTSIARITEFLFADDCALNAANHQDMQKSMDLFSAACDNFGLTISTKKTEVMFQPAPNHPHVDAHIKVNGEELKSVSRFCYLGSNLSRHVNIDEEADTRIAKASAAFGRLGPSVWNRPGIKVSTKLAVYKAVVITTLLYGAETWTIYRRHEKKLNRFHLNCLRKLLGIRWQDKIPDTEVLTKAKMPSIFAMLRRIQLRWAGHVVRMDSNRLPKQLFFGELTAGTRSRGGQKKRYKDSAKASMKDLSIDPALFEELANDRSSWRALLKTGSANFEAMRISAAVAKRDARKNRTQPAQNPGALSCAYCGRHFQARIGLISHLRTHPSSHPS